MSKAKQSRFSDPIDFLKEARSLYQKFGDLVNQLDYAQEIVALVCTSNEPMDEPELRPVEKVQLLEDSFGIFFNRMLYELEKKMGEDAWFTWRSGLVKNDKWTVRSLMKEPIPSEEEFRKVFGSLLRAFKKDNVGKEAIHRFWEWVLPY